MKTENENTNQTHPKISIILGNNRKLKHQKT